MAEFDWIDKYLRPMANSPGAMGLLDDVALLSGGDNQTSRIVTMDTLVETIHFLPSDPRSSVGQKLARVNISDVICKGALPHQALFSAAIPSSCDEADFKSFVSGLRSDFDEWQIELLGGDLVSTNGPLVLTLALTGKCLGQGPVTRSGARTGDVIYVSGAIGAGHIGLVDTGNGVDSLSARHYRVPEIPAPNIARLVSRFANASIDISDGLISEARHIAKASNIAVRIDLDAVRWAEEVSTSEQALELASGGDDYQTMLTVPASLEGDFVEAARQYDLQVSRIGEALPGRDVSLTWNGKDVTIPAATGFQH